MVGENKVGMNEDTELSEWEGRKFRCAVVLAGEMGYVH